MAIERFRKTFFSLFALTLFAFVMLLAILFNVDPQAADVVTLAAVFASIFLILFGFLTLVIFYLRVKLSNWEILYGQVPIAMRHAALVAFGVTGLAFLQMLRVLGWWEVGLYLLILLLLEAYFRTRPTLHG